MIKDFALIIGSMKSGTTSLFNYLAQHPEIAPCKHKEPHFFAKKERFAKGFEYYQSLWDWNPQQHKVALEASASYTTMPSSRENFPSHKLNAAASIFELQQQKNVNFKFIYIMRNPLERLESHYTHKQSWKYHRVGLTSQMKTKMTDVSKYAMQLEEYATRFGKENILLLSLEEFKSEHNKVMRRLCDFLEIDSSYHFQGLKENYNSYKDKQRMILPGWYKFRKSKVMDSLMMEVSPGLKKAFRSVFSRKINQEYVQLDSAEREKILNELNADLKKLNSEYGIEVNSWGIEL